ncbi:L-threonylcarbamoyladenylate synthase [Candidatus Endowatersipora endosymbiont of Watersipora subatra]|uniref:L-threonylcarbamoyladenylate synthase n=1 Tax=Candidatus Endowatersipora endosymbiont of Watersipora subatra TaxID=3077946 RepID=UPI00312C6FAC
MEGLNAARTALYDGQLVGVPTETVYGLAADATNCEAVVRIYTVKNRPSFNPLIIHVSNLAMAHKYGQFNAIAEHLALAFWPGPLTLVVPLNDSSGISPVLTSDLKTIALRQPQGVMATLSELLQKPLAAPSANVSGKLSPTRASHVQDSLGDSVDVILDAGPCIVGLESTIIQIDDLGCFLLREGGIASEDIELILKQKFKSMNLKKKEGSIIAPGMLLSHYAPSKPLKLNVNSISINPKDALLAFGQQPIHEQTCVAVRNLSTSGNLVEAAKNLFAMLSELDKTDASSILVQPIPFEGLGAAVNDRLKRAASR